MSRNGYAGPKLPKVLLDQVQNSSDSRFRHNNTSRKDRRKAERQQKKLQQRRPAIVRQRGHKRTSYGVGDGDQVEQTDDISSPEPAPPVRVAKNIKPLKSILKKSKPVQALAVSESESDPENGESSPPIISRVVKDRLADDDAEIAALEKKLGIKGKKSKALEQDGLNWLADGSESGSEDDSHALKRKRPGDVRWLRDKRLKAGGKNDLDGEDDLGSSKTDQYDERGSDGEEDALENPFSEDELSSDEFEAFESDDEEDIDRTEVSRPKTQRENPYVAPVSKDTAPVAKYVPPSLRKPAASDEEALKQLRRQVQGILNRLSEANMLSIIQSLEDLYSKNARQHVTSTLVDLLVGLVSDASILNDTFLILHAGFAAGTYKVVGTDFGAQLLEKVVESIDRFHKSHETKGKQTLNLIGFLSCLYTFQVVGSAMMFDYIRLFLSEISEANTELLLRMIRTSGQQLRQDDPSALKDVVLLLQRSVAKTGEAEMSVRTKFMIETINDLKNNRMKTGLAATTVSAEHTTRMKKLLGSLASSRSVKATEPLRITLADIQDSEKKGKWWLIGASYHDPSKLAGNDDDNRAVKTRHEDLDAGYESETPGSVNLHMLARSQGMNTDVRRAIFIAIMSSADYTDAHMRILKLHLKNKQMLEIPRVLVHCTGAEHTYNPFYTLVALKICTEHRLRKAFQFQLWDVFRKLEANEDDEEVEQQMTVRQVVNLAKFYGALIADRGLNIAALKKLDFSYLQPNSSMFVEVLLSTIFTQIRKAHPSTVVFEQVVKEVFMQSAGALNIVQGLRLAIEASVCKAELANGSKERRAIEKGCQFAVDALDEAMKSVPVAYDDEVDDEYV